MIWAGALILVGIGIALAGFAGGLGTAPTSAPQQAVQELRLIFGALGLVIAGLGAVVLFVDELRRTLERPKAPPTPVARPPAPRAAWEPEHPLSR